MDVAMVQRTELALRFEHGELYVETTQLVVVVESYNTQWCGWGAGALTSMCCCAPFWLQGVRDCRIQSLKFDELSVVRFLSHCEAIYHSLPEIYTILRPLSSQQDA